MKDTNTHSSRTFEPQTGPGDRPKITAVAVNVTSTGGGGNGTVISVEISLKFEAMPEAPLDNVQLEFNSGEQYPIVGYLSNGNLQNSTGAPEQIFLVHPPIAPPEGYNTVNVYADGELYTANVPYSASKNGHSKFAEYFDGPVTMTDRPKVTAVAVKVPPTIPENEDSNEFNVTLYLNFDGALSLNSLLNNVKLVFGGGVSYPSSVYFVNGTWDPNKWELSFILKTHTVPPSQSSHPTVSVYSNDVLYTANVPYKVV